MWNGLCVVLHCSLFNAIVVVNFGLFCLTVSNISQTTKSKRVRSVSVEDDTSVNKNTVSATRPRAKTLPRNLGHQHQNVLEHSKEGKSARRPPPPPIPTRPPVVVQYQHKSVTASSPLRTSQSSLHSGCSSTPSIPEDSLSPPFSPHVISPSPDSHIPEMNLSQQTTDATRKQLHPDGATNMEQASDSHDHKSRSKGYKLFSTLKGTFRRHSKNPADERRMSYSVESGTEPVVVSHRRAKTVKDGVPITETEGDLTYMVCGFILILVVSKVHNTNVINSWLYCE